MPPSPKAAGCSDKKGSGSKSAKRLNSANKDAKGAKATDNAKGENAGEDRRHRQVIRGEGGGCMYHKGGTDKEVK